MKTKIPFSLDVLAASGASTVSDLPLDQLIEPLQNVLVGVVSALVIRGFSWLVAKMKS